MEGLDFDDLFSQARELSEHAAALFKEVTGEDLDLEAAIKHYPVVSLGLAAAAGVVGGWVLAHRQKQKLLPEETRLSERGAAFFDRVDRIFPGGRESFLRSVPLVPAENTAARFSQWIDDVFEPGLRKGIDSLSAELSDGKIGGYLKQAFEGPDTSLPDDPASS